MAPELARRWLETARADVMAARNCVDGSHFLPGIAAYHCQQAGEKLVKAVLIHREIEPIRTHDIDLLVGRLPPTDSIRPILAPLGRFRPYAGRVSLPRRGCRPGPPERKEISDWIAEIDMVMRSVAGEIEVG